LQKLRRVLGYLTHVAPLRLPRLARLHALLNGRTLDRCLSSSESSKPSRLAHACHWRLEGAPS
jgi:hypothetical protein